MHLNSPWNDLATSKSTTSTGRVDAKLSTSNTNNIIYITNMDQLCKMTWTISLVISMVALSSCRELVRSPWSELDSLQQNNAPIIGVLAQETSWKMEEAWPNKYTSYIAASYIKFVEGGGARAVPIW